MRTALLLAFTLTALGCSKRDDDKPASTPPQKTGSATNPEPPAVNAGDEPMAPGSTVSGINLSGLGEKLKSERDHRGAGPSTDALFGALEKASFQIERRKQILGITAAANYCEDARVAGLIVVICEYGSEKEAAAGKVLVDKNWLKDSGQVERTINKSTVISVIHSGHKTQDVDKILAALKAV